MAASAVRKSRISLGLGGGVEGGVRVRDGVAMVGGREGLWSARAFQVRLRRRGV